MVEGWWWKVSQFAFYRFTGLHVMGTARHIEEINDDRRVGTPESPVCANARSGLLSEVHRCEWKAVGWLPRDEQEGQIVGYCPFNTRASFCVARVTMLTIDVSKKVTRTSNSNVKSTVTVPRSDDTH